MGTNKRYADKIDARMDANIDRSTARPPLARPVVSDWVPPWPPIIISEVEWIIMRDSKHQPAAIIRTVTMGPRNERFFRVVTWAPKSEDRQLVGYFETLAIADRSVKFDPSQPSMPDPRTSTGHGSIPGR